MSLQRIYDIINYGVLSEFTLTETVEDCVCVTPEDSLRVVVPKISEEKSKITSLIIRPRTNCDIAWDGELIWQSEAINALRLDQIAFVKVDQTCGRNLLSLTYLGPDQIDLGEGRAKLIVLGDGWVGWGSDLAELESTRFPVSFTSTTHPRGYVIRKSDGMMVVGTEYQGLAYGTSPSDLKYLDSGIATAGRATTAVACRPNDGMFVACTYGGNIWYGVNPAEFKMKSQGVRYWLDLIYRQYDDLFIGVGWSAGTGGIFYGSDPANFTGKSLGAASSQGATSLAYRPSDNMLVVGGYQQVHYGQDPSNLKSISTSYKISSLTWSEVRGEFIGRAIGSDGRYIVYGTEPTNLKGVRTTTTSTLTYWFSIRENDGMFFGCDNNSTFLYGTDLANLKSKSISNVRTATFQKDGTFYLPAGTTSTGKVYYGTDPGTMDFVTLEGGITSWVIPIEEV